jgi:hypothetical protein
MKLPKVYNIHPPAITMDKLKQTLFSYNCRQETKRKWFKRKISNKEN